MATDHNFKVNNGLTVKSGQTTLTSSTTGSDSYILRAFSSSGAEKFYIRSDGVTVVSGSQYFYVTASGGAYVNGLTRLRGGVTNDQGDLSLSDTVNITGDLKTGGTVRLDSSGNLSNIATATITGGSGTADLHITNTSPTLGFTDTNSFSDANDIYIIRGTSSGKLQFQFHDSSANTTTETFLIDQSGNAAFAGEVYAKDSNSTVDPTYAFTGHTNSGLSIYNDGSSDFLNLITSGVRRAYVNTAGITSFANVYTASNGAFRNYGGVWAGTTGVANNGFYFLNSANSNTTKAMELSHDGNVIFPGTISSGAITARADTDALFVKSITNQNAAEIAFSSQGPSSYAQVGRISYQHGDTQAYGGTDVFTIGTTETAPRILADGLLMFKSGLALKPASGTGAGTTLITSGRALQNITSINTSGTIDSGAITSTGIVRSANYFQVDSSQDLVRVNITAWGSNAEQTVLKNGFNSTIKDHLIVKASGNGTNNHGAIVIADDVFAYGRTESLPTAAASLTAPFTSNSFQVTNTGNATFAGSITSGGNIVAEDSEVHVGNTTGDSWTRIKHAEADGYGFDFQHDNATVIVNEQGSTNQVMVLGDVDAANYSGLFGVAHTTNSGTAWTKKLDLKGNGELYIGSSGTSQVYHEGHKPTYTELGTMAYSNLTGTPTIPSLSGYATESYVGTQITNLIDGAPGTLNTLNELAAAVADNNTFFSTVLPKSGGEMTGALTIDVDNQAAGALRIEANQTNPDNDMYWAQEIISTLSGTTTVTGDREQGGIYIDLNSTATGGDTSNEHRMYGVHVDLDSTGDADLAVAIYGNATATPTTGTTTNVMGGYFLAEDNGGAGNVSNVYAVQGLARADNSDSDTNLMYGGYFKAYNVADSAAIPTARGVYGEVEIATGSGDVFGNTYVIEAQYDNNSDVQQTHTSALFYGNYAGTLPTTAYGLYIPDDVRNYMGGSITGKLGTAANATYSFNGDINTGMYSPADHELGFTTNGGQRLKLSSTEATFTTDVRLPDSGKLYLWNGHNSNYIMYDEWTASASAGMAIKNIAAGGSLIFQTVSTTALTLDSSQNATFAGDLTIPDQIIHSGDTDTYFQFQAANQARIVAGNNEITEWRSDRMQMTNKPITFTNWNNFAETSLSGFNYAALNAPIHIPAVNVGGTDKYLSFLQGSAQHTQGYRTNYVFGGFKKATTGAAWGNGQSGFFMGMGGNDNNPTTEFRFSYDGHIWHSTGGSGTYIDLGAASNEQQFATDGTVRFKLDTAGGSFVAGNELTFFTAGGSERGFIKATDTNDEHLIIATSGGEDIAFKDGGLSGTTNMIIRGDGSMWLRGAIANGTIPYSQVTGTPTIPTNNNQLTNGAGYITSADGGNATTLDNLDSSQFFRNTSNIGSTAVDNLTTRGVYGNSNESSGQPYDNNAGTIIHLDGRDGNYKSQIFQYSANGAMWLRGKHGGSASWSSWYQVYDEQHKPTYSELGTMAYSNLTGTPTIPDISGKVDIGSGFANNRVLTAANSDTAQGEANLTFDGSNLTVGGDIQVNGNQVRLAAVQARVKYSVWTGDTYGIGMQTGYTFGGINNEYVMSFQMNDDADRGFWWGDTTHTNAQGAMALTTDGYLTVARGMRLGYGESDTTHPSNGLDVSGGISSNSLIRGRNTHEDDETLFAITDNDNDASIRAKFETTSSDFNKYDDADAPASGVFTVAGPINPVWGPYIPIDDNTEIMFETWVKHISGSDSSGNFYAGGQFYNGSKTSLGNNSRYWGSSGDSQDSDHTTWRHIKGVMKGSSIRSQSNTSTAKYVRFLTLFNYNTTGNTTAFCGFRFYRSKKTISSLYLKRHQSNPYDDSNMQATEAAAVDQIIDNSGNIYAPGSITVDGTVDGVDIAARNTVLTSTTTTANAALPKAGGTMSGQLTLNGQTISMGNGAIINANNLTFNDPGAQEGIKWNGGSEWQIYESPNTQTNAAGNLQFTSGSGNGTRRLTLDTSGNLEATGDLTIPRDIIHSGDTDTYIRLTDDRIQMHAGGVHLIDLEEGTTDKVSLANSIWSVTTAGHVNHAISNTGIATTYGNYVLKNSDAQVDLVSSSAGTWGSAVNFVQGASGSANTDVWSIARKTTSGGNSLNFNFGTSNQHDNTTQVTFGTDGAISTSGYITGTRLRAGDGTDGYFYSDAAGRTAFTGGNFYIRSEVANCYLYAANTYLGASSGDNIRFRANTVIADSWGITSGGGISGSSFRSTTGEYYGSATDSVRYRGYGDTAILQGVSGATYLYAGGSTTTALTLQAGRTVAPILSIGQVNSYSDVITSARAVQNITSIDMSGNLYMNKSQPYLIISNTTEDAGGIVFTDNQADNAGVGGPGTSSQAFRMTYHCGNETMIMGHDNDSYAGFQFGIGGTFTASGDVVAYSDERLKSNIKTLNGEKVLEMRGVSFEKNDKESSGVIAQEMEKVAPELVHTDEITGMKSVAYGNLVGYLIEAVKGQQETINKLTDRINDLENKEN